ncbi:MAG: sugar phosphate nucleotidyltransferase [Candidatus Bathyarchaeia archaeon]
MKALILAGGFGTRLRPLSCTRPKILFPILNKPLLQWTLERLEKNGVKEAILAVNKQTEIMIKQHRIKKCELQIIYSLDPLKKPLGTGGPIKKAEKIIGLNSPFLVLNGDIYADVKYTEILKEHEGSGAVATIALHEVEDPTRYGVAELTEEKRIKRFTEKPQRKDAPTNLVNAGVYAFSPKIFNYIPYGRAVSLEHEVFPKLAGEGKLYGYIFDGLWADMGKLEDYFRINRVLLNALPDKHEYNIECKGEIRKPVAFDNGVSISEKSIIGPYAILGKNVKIGKNVRIENAIIFPEVTISDFASIDNAIIGEGAVIGRRVKIEGGCVLGDYVKVKDYVSLIGRVSVCPAKEVSPDTATYRCII